MYSVLIILLFKFRCLGLNWKFDLNRYNLMYPTERQFDRDSKCRRDGLLIIAKQTE